METQTFEKHAHRATGGAERRKYDRIRLQIPLFIRGTNAQGEEFLELAKTLDISCSGARIVTAKSLQGQRNIQLTVPAPLPRSANFGECGSGPISAHVCRVEASGEMEVAAVEFLRPLN